MPKELYKLVPLPIVFYRKIIQTNFPNISELDFKAYSPERIDSVLEDSNVVNALSRIFIKFGDKGIPITYGQPGDGFEEIVEAIHQEATRRKVPITDEAIKGLLAFASSIKGEVFQGGYFRVTELFLKAFFALFKHQAMSEKIGVSWNLRVWIDEKGKMVITNHYSANDMLGVDNPDGERLVLLRNSFYLEEEFGHFGLVANESIRDFMIEDGFWKQHLLPSALKLLNEKKTFSNLEYAALTLFASEPEFLQAYCQKLKKMPLADISVALEYMDLAYSLILPFKRSLATNKAMKSLLEKFGKQVRKAKSKAEKKEREEAKIHQLQINGVTQKFYEPSFVAPSASLSIVTEVTCEESTRLYPHEMETPVETHEQEIEMQEVGLEKKEDEDEQEVKDDPGLNLSRTDNIGPDQIRLGLTRSPSPTSSEGVPEEMEQEQTPSPPGSPLPTQEQFEKAKLQLAEVSVTETTEEHLREAASALLDAINNLSTKELDANLPFLTSVLRQGALAIAVPSNGNNITKLRHTIETMEAKGWRQMALGVGAIILGCLMITACATISLAAFGTSALLAGWGIAVSTSLLTKGIAITLGVTGLGVASVGAFYTVKPSLKQVTHESSRFFKAINYIPQYAVRIDDEPESLTFTSR
jgi:hypothetical protein